MIWRLVLCLALVCIAGPASVAISADCSLYKVNTSLLIVSKEAGGNIYIDALEDGEIACVTREQNVDGRDWVYIAYKLDKSSKQTQVDGWSAQRSMKKLSAAEAAAISAGSDGRSLTVAPAPPPAASAPAAKAAPPAPATAPPAAAPERVATAIRPEDSLRFDQPVPFGAFPVTGHSIKEIIENNVPLFPPIEGLDDAIWQKKCTECHKWNQARLCDQGKTYVKDPRNVLRVKHPFGGALKIALMRWAKSGCQ